MKRNGYSLIEILACIALLAALFPAASKFFVSVTRLHGAQTASLDRMFVFEQIERDLRADARAATEIVPNFGAYKTEKRTIILRNREYTAVYTANGHFQPQRIQFTAQPGGKWEQRITTYPETSWRSRFEAKGNTVEFTARPPRAASPKRTPAAEVHVLAAIGFHGGAVL